MKFTIVLLLGLSAFVLANDSTATNEEDNSGSWGLFAGKIKAKIDALLQSASEEFENTAARAREIFGKIKERAAEVYNESIEKLKEWRENIREYLEDVKVKNEVSQKCHEEFKPQFDEVFKQAEFEVKECVGVVVVQGEEKFKRDVEGDIADIKDNVQLMKDVVYECFQKGFWSSGKCLYNEFSNLKNSFVAIVESSKEVLAIAKARYEETEEKVQECKDLSKSRTTEKLDKLKAEFANCISQE